MKAHALGNLVSPVLKTRNLSPLRRPGCSTLGIAGNIAGKYCGRTSVQSGAEEVVTLDCSIKVGQSVEIIEGPFQGLEVVVTHLLPAKERIRVLFDFLGRSVEMDVPIVKVLAA